MFLVEQQSNLQSLLKMCVKICKYKVWQRESFTYACWRLLLSLWWGVVKLKMFLELMIWSASPLPFIRSRIGKQRQCADFVRVRNSCHVHQRWDVSRDLRYDSRYDCHFVTAVVVALIRFSFTLNLNNLFYARMHGWILLKWLFSARMLTALRGTIYGKPTLPLFSVPTLIWTTGQ